MEKKKKAPAPLGALIVRLFHQDITAAEDLAGDLVLESFTDIANCFDVSVNTVKTSWRKVGNMPGQRGAYRLANLVRWKLERETLPKKQEPTAAESPLGRKRVADARKAEVSADKLELEIQQTSGELLYRDDVEREISEALMILRRTLERISSNLKPRFPKRLATELAAAVSKEVNGALVALAGNLEGMADRLLS